MRLRIDQTKWWETPMAALIFFTRLPFWRLCSPSKTCYQHVVEYWPLTGWLTGGIMALTFYITSAWFTLPVAVLLAIIARILTTGALHEDGLADFLDGFGGGYNRERILSIMKDSHIGTYGVLGLILYFALLATTLLAIGDHEITTLTPSFALDNADSASTLLLASTILAADPFCKMVSGQLIMFLPYARKEEEAKSKTVYVKYGLQAGLRLALTGLMPLVGWGWMMNQWFAIPFSSIEVLVAVPCIVFYLLYLLMNRKLQGYTGDCCGATFLLTELSFYLAFAATL